MSYTGQHMTHPAQNKLRAWRAAQEKSVNDAAAEIGCTRQTWYSWESGSNIPSPDFMARLVKLTDGAVTANDFYALIAHTDTPLGDTASGGPDGNPEKGLMPDAGELRRRSAA